MKLRLPVFVLLCLVWVAPAAQAPGDLLKSTFDKMDAASAKFKGMTAEVKRINHINSIGENDVETGTVAVKRTKPRDLRMRADVQEPDRRMICFADRRGEVYNPKTNTVQIYGVSRKDSAVAEQFLLLGFGSSAADVQDGYTVKLGGEEQLNGMKTARLELTPKSRDKLGTVTKIELWISETTDTAGLAVQQKFHQLGNDYNLVTYTNIKLNPNLADSAVKCEVPKDAVKEYPTGH